MKIGIFGGSFDPPTVAHMAVASQSIAQLGLDFLYLVPTGAEVSATTKRSVATPRQRYEMCLAACGYDGIDVSDYETVSKVPIKTVDTLEGFHQIFYGDELWFIMGADSWNSFPLWEDTERIRRLSKIAVFTRTGYPIIENPDTVLDIPESGLSSTWVRKHAKGDLKWLVPDSVIQYIRENNLYEDEVQNT